MVSNFRFGCLAKGARGEVAQCELAELNAVQREHGRAHCGEHAAHLVVFALGQHELGGARRVGEEAQLGGGAGLFFSVKHEGAGGEERDELGREIAVGGRAVELGDLVFRRGVFVDEFRPVGEEDQARCLLVETTDAGDLRVAGAPAFGEKIVNTRSFAFVVRTDEAERFVEQQEKAVGMIELFAIDAHIGGEGFVGRIADGDPAHRDGVLLEKIARLAAGAVAEIGEELVEAAHERAVNVPRERGTKHFAPGRIFKA